MVQGAEGAGGRGGRSAGCRGCRGAGGRGCRGAGGRGCRVGGQRVQGAGGRGCRGAGGRGCRGAGGRGCRGAGGRGCRGKGRGSPPSPPPTRFSCCRTIAACTDPGPSGMTGLTDCPSQCCPAETPGPPVSETQASGPHLPVSGLPDAGSTSYTRGIEGTRGADHDDLPERRPPSESSLPPELLQAPRAPPTAQKAQRGGCGLWPRARGPEESRSVGCEDSALSKAPSHAEPTWS